MSQKISEELNPRRIDSIEEKRSFYPLLTDADPWPEMIEKYLDEGIMFVFTIGSDIVGEVVLLPLSDDVCEVKNIAVYPEFQQKGIGKRIMDFSVDFCKSKFKTICVGTSDSGVAFYEKCGFVVSGKIRNFFTDNYPEPIFDGNGWCVDMICLKIDLTSVGSNDQ